jgi:hypothetical protein
MMKRTKLLFSCFLRAGGRGKAMILTVVVALTLATITPAFAANGGNFLLGRSNTASAVTSLIKSGAGPALQLVVPAGQPPIVVNATAGKATNLNADKLDGKDSTAFASGVGGKATDSDKLDGNDSTAFLGANAKATDADKLDGNDSTELPGLISSVGTFNGGNGIQIIPSPAYQFAGVTTTVTTNSTQRLVGAATVPLATTASTPHNIDYGLCYQSSAGGPISNFTNQFSTTQIDNIRRPYTASASVVPGSGTWKVGFCVRNQYSGAGTVTLDWVNGWVQVVNGPPVAASSSSEPSSEPEKRVEEPNKE